MICLLLEGGPDIVSAGCHALESETIENDVVIQTFQATQEAFPRLETDFPTSRLQNDFDELQLNSRLAAMQLADTELDMEAESFQSPNLTLNDVENSMMLHSPSDRAASNDADEYYDNSSDDLVQQLNQSALGRPRSVGRSYHHTSGLQARAALFQHNLFRSRSDDSQDSNSTSSPPGGPPPPMEPQATLSTSASDSETYGEADPTCTSRRAIPVTPKVEVYDDSRQPNTQPQTPADLGSPMMQTRDVRHGSRLRTL
ncbi:hypothetical protein K470DRAFT_1195 [Piedraia hortae CBS 480.64]|uniref:Uncharacterized protein n=1 Tax=Piedraia hortae CBS 480.64 TaxID=1314780 RepID=A0A6A7CB67_9PEZI|nr:hypothetical protein K470DRAFT_1195 [Piedraia hortae CBS 480.64]